MVLRESDHARRATLAVLDRIGIGEGAGIGEDPHPSGDDLGIARRCAVDLEAHDLGPVGQAGAECRLPRARRVVVTDPEDDQTSTQAPVDSQSDWSKVGTAQVESPVERRIAWAVSRAQA